MHPSRHHLQQRFRLAHEDYFGTTPLQSVSWCFEHHEDKYQSMTIKATLSINLTYQKRLCIFCWLVYGLVLEQALSIPLTRWMCFSLFLGGAVIPGEHQMDDYLASWEGIPHLFQNRDNHITPSLLEPLTPSAADQPVAQSITKFRNFFLFLWMLNLISVLCYSLFFFFFPFFF